MNLPPDELQDQLRNSFGPSVVIIALARWIQQMEDLDSLESPAHREVLTVLLTMINCWAVEIEENQSYSELADALIKHVIRGCSKA